MSQSADEGHAAISGGVKGAEMGSAAGPYGAIIGGLLGTGAGLINANRDLPTVDVISLMNTINTSGQYQRQLINALPEQIKAQLLEYSKSLGEAGSQYKSAIQGLGESLQTKSAAIYGPNSETANLQKDAARKDIYSTVPDTQNAIRNALAATGGLSRGHAATSLAQPYMTAAQDYSKAAGGINADQAAKGQQAQLQAVQTMTNMDESMFMNMFGMSKDQAKTILTSGNQALSDQLAALLSQSATQTNQTLGVQGLAANNGYQNAVTRNSQQNAITTGLTNTGIDVMNGLSTSNGSQQTEEGLV